jgi:putative NIF3 family GTP cyclohydrolase 1 type 2
MASDITVQQVLERMQRNLGGAWKTAGGDGLVAGGGSAVVTGIATTWTPSLDVLRKAAGAKRNLIISRESPYWAHETAQPEFSGSAVIRRDSFTNDPTFKAKEEFITGNRLSILRFSENWSARRPDPQLTALAAALGWDTYRKPGAAGAGFDIFTVPSTTLGALAKSIQASLGARALRVLGDPQAKVAKIALTPGFLLVPRLADALKEPGVDVVVAGEPVEWEAHPYLEDWITAGKARGMINLGSQVSEEPGSGEVASWLKTFITEVPVEWLPAGEPFWPVKA